MSLFKRLLFSRSNVEVMMIVMVMTVVVVVKLYNGTILLLGDILIPLILIYLKSSFIRLLFIRDESSYLYGTPSRTHSPRP